MMILNTDLVEKQKKSLKKFQYNKETKKRHGMKFVNYGSQNPIRETHQKFRIKTYRRFSVSGNQHIVLHKLWYSMQKNKIKKNIKIPKAKQQKIYYETHGIHCLFVFRAYNTLFLQWYALCAALNQFGALIDPHQSGTAAVELGITLFYILLLFIRLFHFECAFAVWCAKRSSIRK